MKNRPYCERRKSRVVRVGRVLLGGDNPVAVQTMTTTPTTDVESTLAEISRLSSGGAEIVRLAVPTLADARALAEIRRRTEVPLVADIHFTAALALAAIESGVDKVRLNPGNTAMTDDLRRVLDAAARREVAIRIGVNSGSVMPRDVPVDRPHSPQEIAARMVEAVAAYLRLFESVGFSNIVLSLKASDVPTTVEAYRQIAAMCDYPLHLGITAAGPREEAVLKSAAGLGTLLSEGIGDTIRVSITGDPLVEVQIGRRLLEVLHLRELAGVEIISCPTCGRCQVDLTPLAEQLYALTRDIRKPLRVAVMGCVVNGPGEAREADLGVAAGKGFGVIFRRGQSGEKVDESLLLERMLREIRLAAAD
jgi:(E)-4-hydroxy-3-methylbut-2-enyl-diphosphate synthase